MTSINHAEVAETLHRAADLIEQRGWVGTGGQGWLDAANPGHPLCIEGAIAAAAEIPSAMAARMCPAAEAVGEYLGITERFNGGPRLFSWNDEAKYVDGEMVPARTANEVIEVLRAAAAIEQAKHDTELPPIQRFEDGSWSVILPAGWRAASVRAASDTEDAWVTSW